MRALHTLPHGFTEEPDKRALTANQTIKHLDFQPDARGPQNQTPQHKEVSG